jgi:hypothetical protein
MLSVAQRSVALHYGAREGQGQCGDLREGVAQAEVLRCGNEALVVVLRVPARPRTLQAAERITRLHNLWRLPKPLGSLHPLISDSSGPPWAGPRAQRRARTRTAAALGHGRLC